MLNDDNALQDLMVAMRENTQGRANEFARLNDQLEERNHPYRILVVEDNEELRAYLHRSLEKRFSVSLASRLPDLSHRVSRNSILLTSRMCSV